MVLTSVHRNVTLNCRVFDSQICPHYKWFVNTVNMLLVFATVVGVTFPSENMKYGVKPRTLPPLEL